MSVISRTLFLLTNAYGSVSQEPTPLPTNEPTTEATTIPTEIPTVLDDMFLVETPMIWSDADAYCTGLGLHLLSIHTADIHAVAKDLCGTIDHDAMGTWGCWVGLSQNASDHWFWSDMSSTDYGFAGGAPTTGLYPWASGEPNNWNNVEDCGILLGVWDAGYTWNDFSCTTSNYPICQGMH